MSDATQQANYWGSLKQNLGIYQPPARVKLESGAVSKRSNGAGVFVTLVRFTRGETTWTKALVQARKGPRGARFRGLEIPGGMLADLVSGAVTCDLVVRATDEAGDYTNGFEPLEVRPELGLMVRPGDTGEEE